MKKGFSILLVLLMASTMLPITVATHYCGGEIAASKISISGKLASCGMEGPEKRPALPGNSITTNCCDDVVTLCRTDINYKPFFYDISDSDQYNYKIFPITAGYPLYQESSLISLSLKARPPGVLMSTCVDLSGICAFRI